MDIVAVQQLLYEHPLPHQPSHEHRTLCQRLMRTFFDYLSDLTQRNSFKDLYTFRNMDHGAANSIPFEDNACCLKLAQFFGLVAHSRGLFAVYPHALKADSSQWQGIFSKRARRVQPAPPFCLDPIGASFLGCLGPRRREVLA